MKILFWTPIFWPDIGGIELISLQHVQSLVEHGHECVVITSHGRVKAPDLLELGGIPVHRFPIVSAFRNKDLRQLLVIQKEISTLKETFLPDLEHLNFGGPAPIGYFYLRTMTIPNVPLVVALHGSVQGLNGSLASITGQILHAASWTTACSKAMLEDAQQVVPGIRERSFVIHYGLQGTKILPEPLPFDNLCILCLGRLVPEKGFDLAIQTFAQLVKNYPHARLVIAGDGPARSQLEQQAADLQLGSVVEFTGAYEPQAVYAMINKATLVVIPSRWREAFGLVALEAAQMARPVVATRVGGLEEAVMDGQTGLLFSNGNSQDLARKIANLLDHPEIATQLGRNGRARVLTEFTWREYINAYENLYHTLAPGKS